MEGALRALEFLGSAGWSRGVGNVQDCSKAFLVDGHLDRDVGQVVVDHLVRTWGNGGVVLRVLVVLADRTNAHGDILYDLEGKELHGGLVSETVPYAKRM